MQPVYSVELHLPDDKQPGYYAQIVKGVAAAVTVVDRDKTLLFLNSAEDADTVEAFVERYRVACDRGMWLPFNADWELNDRLFSDYGVETRFGGCYLDLALAAIVAVSAESAQSELLPAMLQAEEHAIARTKLEDGRQLLAVDRHQVELIGRIVAAYRCKGELVL